MKYGIIYPHYGKEAYKYPGYNMGDAVQTMCVMQFYEELQIPESEVVYLNLNEINTYRGEKLIVPMVGAAVGIGFALLPLSPDIIPIFISTHFAMSELTQEQVEYLKRFEPIGCRDEFGNDLMSSYGIRAYISGCMTLCLSRQFILSHIPLKSNVIELEHGSTGRRPYFIDVPKSLSDYIPDSYNSNAVFLSHLISLNNNTVMSNADAERLFSRVKQRLFEYLTNASIVISSRLHAIVPCIAMGIPVIGVFDNISYRFSWLDRLIPLYSERKFSAINWNPDRVDAETIILKMKELISASILRQNISEILVEEVSSFWKNRNKSNYGSHTYDRLIDVGFASKKEYIIWGCGLTGHSCYKTIQKTFPDAKLVTVIDTYLEGSFHGVSIQHPSVLTSQTDAYIILATYAGRDECYKKMREIGKREEQDFVFIGTMNG